MFIVDKLPKSITAESYRSLRTNIQYSSIDKQVKTLVVTSSNAGEGKSTVAGNLAYTFFQSGKRVLIIDCDLRKPSLHRKFNVSNEVGLTDVLVGTSELNKVMKKIDDNLYLLTTGTLPPNPAEIIGSNTMENFLDECKINFDYIILDTPPILPVTDSKLLAIKADATVLVVRSEISKLKHVSQAFKELGKVNANVIGTILNDVEVHSERLYYNNSTKSKKSKIYSLRKLIKI
ncbi:MAG: CpsD/CapB family tyrosine-protein kinase [Terrisporobacter sp.]|uniref:CpsD/CapB family tyrosine-protein kinase n=1 Tax=Terrisporobacter sp. TaxID=1965305 RepID=UPI002A9158F5|nr:CpsD/CapB family tyrosine-protein kinase [Terrisporobacter sp.]MCI6458426.1 CpsD/CapB family tyrosine-protein kinase [Clostridium sp.]MDY6153134.1 CpsD/CapB family tyrosine-protein kinase [Terrisporobacter sp.]